MAVKLKKVKDQVIVVTGASSGIGLATALEAAERGASVVISARSGRTIEGVADHIRREGGKALAVVCDVTDKAQVENLAAKAVAHFGRIDTWVNNAGMGLWARLDQTPEEAARRMFDVNFWGVVHGCRAALPHLQAGGAIINVGSEASDAVPPLLGMYAATKHAVKGYTDGLRIELERVDGAPISVTLIQPTAVDTPFPQHAYNVTDREPMLPQAPLIEPKKVAEAICDAAQSHTRDKAVGIGALMNTMMEAVFPRLAERFSAKMVDKMHYDEPPRNPEGAFFRSSEEVGVAGRTHGTGGVKPK